MVDREPETETQSPDRPTQVLALYQQELIFDEPQDLLVDILTELRLYAEKQGWNFSYALWRSAEELNRKEWWRGLILASLLSGYC